MEPLQSGKKADELAGKPADGPASKSLNEDMIRIYPPSNGAYTEQLAKASQAFAVGDFKTARTLAKSVNRDMATAEEAQFSDEILKRTRVDLMALWVGLGCLVFFVFIVWSTWK